MKFLRYTFVFLCLLVYQNTHAFTLAKDQWWDASFQESPFAEIVTDEICQSPSQRETIKTDNSHLILAAYNDNELARRLITKHIWIYTTRKKEDFQRWLNRSGMYIETIKRILREEDLPEELVYLPIIESGYYPKARSHRRAVGPWQFIPATARKYGLKINYWVDERRDPEKSTHAAARYLKDLFLKFNSWHLALAAYNAGEGRIYRAIKKTKSEDFWDILQTKYIKSETRNYVAKFIAAALIATNPDLYGFDTKRIKAPLRYEKVKIDKPVSLKFVARCTETDIRTIRLLNPELKQWCTPPEVGYYELRVPEGKSQQFLQCFQKASPKERLPMVPYQIKKGDTISHIAKRYGLKVRDILALNKKVNPRRLMPGDTIYLPPYR